VILTVAIAMTVTDLSAPRLTLRLPTTCNSRGLPPCVPDRRCV